MAKLTISPQLIAEALFGDSDVSVRIVGARWNGFHELIELEIVGDAVPNAECVVAKLERRSRFHVTFEPQS